MSWDFTKAPEKIRYVQKLGGLKLVATLQLVHHDAGGVPHYRIVAVALADRRQR